MTAGDYLCYLGLGGNDVGEYGGPKELVSEVQPPYVHPKLHGLGAGPRLEQDVNGRALQLQHRHQLTGRF